MHCVSLSSSLGNAAWRIARSVEVLGYHRDRGRVSILYVLLAKNLNSDRPNSLHLLHRGRVEARIVPAWPLPPHPDEKRANAVSGPLASLFLRRDGEILLTDEALAGLEPDLQRGPTFVCSSSGPKVLEPNFALPDGGSHVPFTTWTIDVDRPGWHLIAVELAFDGETYSRLLPPGQVFTVDGPERLLARIRYLDLSGLSVDDHRRWGDRLAPFMRPEQKVSPGRYDIVVLGPPCADPISPVDGYGASAVYEVADASRCEPQLRYRAVDESFSLPLSFAQAEALAMAGS